MKDLVEKKNDLITRAEEVINAAKAEKRDASFQMVIDDVYAIGKGRLVGRPKY